MRKTIVIAAAIFMAAAAFGQSPIVTLSNQESASFYYVIDPKDLAGITPGSPLLASRVASFFAAQGGDPAFSELAPGGEARITSLSDGTHLLVGFFAVQDEDFFPVRVLSLQADSQLGERFYTLYAAPAQLSVTRGTGRLSGFAKSGIQVAAAQPASSAAPAASAGAESSPSRVPPIATFAGTYDPTFFTRETKDSFTVLPISDSRAWTSTGTRITALSGLLQGGNLRLALTVPGGFSEKVSYFFYVFENRAQGAGNTLTLEIEPRADGSRGACLVWLKDAAPRVVGTVKSTAATVEVSIEPLDLAAEILSHLGSGATVDLTAAWYDRALGTWEEFYYTTFATADIPATR